MPKTDASLIGIAGLLLQEQEGEYKTVSCVSHHLKPAEKNYSPMEIEALAVVYSLSKFRHFLLGRHFKIKTHHSALKVLNSRNTRNARLERWALALSEYDYEIIYQKGKLHEDADCLSPAPIQQPQDEFLDNILTITTLPLNPDDWVEAYDDDESDLSLLKAMEQEDDFEIKQNLVYHQNKLYVPLAKREQILQESLSSNLAAHDGIQGTLERLNSFWWPTMATDTAHYVRKCHECQKRKVERRGPAGTMRPHEAFSPMEIMAFDYVGALPETIK